MCEVKSDRQTTPRHGFHSVCGPRRGGAGEGALLTASPPHSQAGFLSPPQPCCDKHKGNAACFCHRSTHRLKQKPGGGGETDQARGRQLAPCIIIVILSFCASRSFCAARRQSWSGVLFGTGAQGRQVECRSR